MKGAKPFGASNPGMPVVYWLHHAYWFSLFVITPLLLSPTTLFTLDASGVESTPLARAVFCWLLVTGGVVVLLKSFPDIRLRDLPSVVKRLPLPLKVMSVFLVVLGASTRATSAAPVAPLLGSDVRYDGTLIQIGWYLLVLVSAGMSSTRIVSPNQLVRYVATGAAITSTWIVLQAYHVDPLTFLSRSHLVPDYAAGALGHGAIASGYIAMCLMVVIGTARGRRHWLGWRILVIPLLVVGMLAAGGRTGLVAVVATAVLALGYLSLSHRLNRQIVVVAAVVSLVALGTLLIVPQAGSRARTVANAFAGNDASFNHRVITWRVATRIIRANPLRGIGADGFAYAVWDHTRPEEQRQLLSEVIGRVPAPGSYRTSGNVVVYRDADTGAVTSLAVQWDKAHNYYLDLALANGVPSLVLFVTFLATALWNLVRSESAFSQAVALALIVFAIYGLAWFFTVNLDPFLWGLTGAALGQGRERVTSLGQQAVNLGRRSPTSVGRP